MIGIMLDLETLDNKINSVILSIGAIAFDLSASDDIKIINKFYRNILIEDQIKKYNKTISDATFEWWMKQEPEVQDSLTKNRVGYECALYDFLEFTSKYNLQEVWCQGIDFDIPIIERAISDIASIRDDDGFLYAYIENMGGTQFKLWHYSSVRDLRTLASIFPTATSANTNKLKHNALADAEYQLENLSNILKYIKKTSNNYLLSQATLFS